MNEEDEKKDPEQELKEELERYERQNQEAYDEETKANEELRKRQEERKKEEKSLEPKENNLGQTIRKATFKSAESGLLGTALGMTGPAGKVAGGIITTGANILDMFVSPDEDGNLVYDPKLQDILPSISSRILEGTATKGLLKEQKDLPKDPTKALIPPVSQTNVITRFFEGISPAGIEYVRGLVMGDRKSNLNNPPPRDWRYVPPDATQSYKINQKLLDNAVLTDAKDQKFSIAKYEDGKTSQWGRMVGINYQTNPNTRVGWEKTKKELRQTWETLYGAAMQGLGYKTEDIQIEHIFTIQQSMPIYEGVKFGSPLYNKIQERILKRGYDPGNTDRNLMAIFPHLHQQKTNYFNALHGKDGRGFFTQEMIDRFAAGDDEYRFEVLEKYLDEVDMGKKILDDAIEVFDSLNIGRGYMPEEIAERLGQIELNDYSAPELKKIFSDMEADGFKLNPKESAKAEAAEIKTEKQAADAKAKKQIQLDKDTASVEKLQPNLEKFLNENLDTFAANPYPLGMKDEGLREFAEEEFKKFKQAELDELPIKGFGTEIFGKEQEDKFVKLTMKSILNRIRRDIRNSKKKK